MVARTLIRPPDSRLGPATEAERAAVMARSPVRGVYDQVVDRESAEEILTARYAAEDRIEAEAAAEEAEARAEDAAEKAADKAEAAAAKAERARARSAPRAAPRARRSTRQTPMEALTKSVLRQAGSTLTRELLRGVLGSLKRR